MVSSPSIRALVFFGLLATSHASLAQPQLSGTPDELREFLVPRPNTVNINGQADLTAYKDVAKVSLQVTTEERSLSEAMTVNQELRLSLIDNFVAAGVPIEDINNSKFSSSPQFGLFGRNLNRYEVSARMEVSVSSEAHLQLLAAAADNNDEVEFENIEFEHSLEDDFEEQVRELALQDAMEQKEFYETNLGLELKAVNFYYGGISRRPRVMPMGAYRQESMDEVAGSALMASSSAVAPTFDEVEYETSVNVVFEIVTE